MWHCSSPNADVIVAVQIHPEWAPLGAERFKEMLDESFFKGIRFFRVIDGFMAQFGIHGKPAEAASAYSPLSLLHDLFHVLTAHSQPMYLCAEWRERQLQDDPVVESNTRGMISFATSGPNSRTTQMFINFGDNSNLDGMGFSPFGKVVDGMDVVDRIYKIGEKPSQVRDVAAIATVDLGQFADEFPVPRDRLKFKAKATATSRQNSPSSLSSKLLRSFLPTKNCKC